MEIIKAIYTIDGKIVNVVVPDKVEYRRLEELYDVCNELFKTHQECFYTSEELERLKSDLSNKFLVGD